MKLLKVSSISLLVLFSLLLGSRVFAVDAVPAVDTPASAKSFFVADTSIQNAKIFAQSGNTINISFNIENGKGAQAGLKYSVSLVKDITNGNMTPVDEYVYPESVSLSANTTVRRDIEYVAPSYLSGDYYIIVQLVNEGNIPLGISNIGKVKLVSTLNTIKILPETCSLSIVGEKGSPKYKLSQYVDINLGEQLSLSCTVSNLSKKDITITPSYETHLNTMYGDVVSNTEGGYVTPITLKTGESKTLNLSLPKTNKPQYYAVKTSFNLGDAYSNSVVSYYTIQGTSAYIRSFSLDKDYYNSGETANLSLLWGHSFLSANSRLSTSSKTPVSFSKDSEPKDSFNPTINLVASITDEKQNACTPAIKQTLDSNGELILPIHITRNCKNPQVKIQLQDKEGNILAEKQLSFKTNIESKEFVKANTFFGKYGMFLIALGILVVAGVAIYFINLKRKGHAKHNLDKQNETTI